MRIRLWLCVLVSTIASSIAAESKPDFSGEWVLVNPDDSAGDVACDLIVRESFEGAGTVLTVERRLKSDVRVDRYKIGLEWGTTSGIAGGQMTRTRFSATWHDDRLVIESGSYSGPTQESAPYAEHDELWSVDTQRRLLIAVTDRGSGTESRTTQFTYRRR